MGDSASLDIVTLIILGLTFDLRNLLSWSVRVQNILIASKLRSFTKKRVNQGYLSVCLFCKIGPIKYFKFFIKCFRHCSFFNLLSSFCFFFLTSMLSTC